MILIDFFHSLILDNSQQTCLIHAGAQQVNIKEITILCDECMCFVCEKFSALFNFHFFIFIFRQIY